MKTIITISRDLVTHDLHFSGTITARDQARAITALHPLEKAALDEAIKTAEEITQNLNILFQGIERANKLDEEKPEVPG